MVDARRNRDHGDGQARRSRRLDLRLLRRVGTKLSLLDRRDAQLLRPILRSAILRPRRHRKLQLPATTTSREWYRPNPPLPTVKWGPRNNTNIQESAILLALNKVAKDKELYLENYWLKNKRSVQKGKDGPVYGWAIPAQQPHRVNTAEMVNDLRHQGVEIDIADKDAAFGNLKVSAGDYIIRADQPYRTLVDMYFSLQNYPVSNPLPYDDTGWTMPLMRNVTVKEDDGQIAA